VRSACVSGGAGGGSWDPIKETVVVAAAAEGAVRARADHLEGWKEASTSTTFQCGVSKLQRTSRRGARASEREETNCESAQK